MLKVKQAINYKSSDGTMKNTGILCNVGALGEEPLRIYGRNLNRMFEEATFPEGTELVVEIPNFGLSNAEQTMYRCFNNVAGLKSIKLKCNDNGVARNATMAFTNCNTVETINLSEFPVSFTNCSQMFNYCTSLVEIIGELDVSNAGVDYFVNACLNLKEIRFKNNCISRSINFNPNSLLSAESIQSIIDGLADLTGQTAQTITFHADVKAKLTEDQISQITSKNWTLA